MQMIKQCCFSLGIFFLPAFFLSNSHAATFTVTKVLDTADGACDADCSLREAVIAANASVGEDTIALPAGTYTLSIAGANEDSAKTGDLDIKDAALVITGAGATVTVIQWAESQDRVFDLSSRTTTPVTIKNVTIQGGNTAKSSSSGGKSGGGIQAFGPLILEECIVKNNTSTDPGGGIRAFHSLAVNRCTFSNNNAQSGGAIEAFSNTSTTGTSFLVKNSSFFNNTASATGGAIQLGTYPVESTITNTTFSKNTAIDGGGAIANYSAKGLKLSNVTLAENTSTSNGGGIHASNPVSLNHTILVNNTASTCSGTVSSLGYNVIDNTAACNPTPSTGDQFGVSTANLSGFTDNSTPGNGHYVLLSGSTAIDASSSTACVRPDQLGNAMLDLCDIGAIEAICGDAAINTVSEECDDGNTTDGDGCSAQCETEVDDNTDTDEDTGEDTNNNDGDNGSGGDDTPNDDGADDGGEDEDSDNDEDGDNGDDGTNNEDEDEDEGEVNVPSVSIEADCTDGFDNDGDGDFDCDDLDCGEASNCTVSSEPQPEPAPADSGGGGCRLVPLY